jgi:hypothetical protein
VIRPSLGTLEPLVPAVSSTEDVFVCIIILQCGKG